MKKRTAILLAGMLAVGMMLNGCGASTADAPKAETSGAQSSESAVTESAEEAQSAASSEKSSENEQEVSSLEDCKLRLIDCHQFEDDGQQFTYLAFALLGPQEIGFHLEGGASEISEAWLTSNHTEGGWRVVTCTELPAGITPESLSLSVTDYSTSEEEAVLLSDWGEPMSKEELQAVGVYEIEGHLALVGQGSTSKSSDQYGFMVGLGLVGPEYGNPETSFPTLENAAQVFRFCAADGTPLTQSLGQEIDECFMTGSTLKVRFALPEGTDADAALARLAEKAPYMEYTNADGEAFQFPLNLEN